MRAGRLAVILVLVLAGIGTAWRLSQPIRDVAPERLVAAISGPSAASGLLLVAQAEGYFAREGVEVAFQPHDSGREALGSVLAGRADVATVGNTPLVFAALEDEPVVILATISKAGQAHGIVARADRGIDSPADLAGKRIGTTLRSDGHYFLDYLMSLHGRSTDAATVVGLAPADLAAALADGRVDAVSTWEPWLGRAESALGGHARAFRTDRGMRVDFNLATTREASERRKDALVRLVKALARAEDLVLQQPERARGIVARATGADPAQEAAAGATYRLLLTLDQGLLTMLGDEARWAIRAGLAGQRDMPDLVRLVDARPLEAARPESITFIH